MLILKKHNSMLLALSDCGVGHKQRQLSKRKITSASWGLLADALWLPANAFGPGACPFSSARAALASLGF